MLDVILARLDSLDAKLCQQSELLQAVIAAADKEWFDTDEVAKMIGRAPWTVREWCRMGRIRAKKAWNGRAWKVSSEEVERYRNEGLLPYSNTARIASDNVAG